MGYRDHILTLLKRGKMIKLKGQGLAIPHMKLNNAFKSRSTGTISRRSLVDQIDSLPSRLSSLKLKKKTSVGKGVARKKLLSGGSLRKSSKKASRKSSKKASRKSSRKASRKASKKSTGGKIRRKKASKKSTGGKIKHKKGSKKQSFKALKFNF